MSAGAVLAVGLVWMVYGWIVDPLDELDNTLRNSLTEQQNKEVEHRKGINAENLLAASRRIALPQNTSEAQRLYSRWVIDLAQSCGFRNIKPDFSIRTEQKFPLINVTMSANVTFEQALQFLKRFSEVDLLQRVSSFEVVSVVEGRMDIKCTLEGMSLPGAVRTALFPSTTLLADATPQVTTLPVSNLTDFPKQAPYRIRIGNEWLTVTAARDGKLTVERGVEHSTAEAHASGALVELVPLRPAPQGTPGLNEAVAQLSAHNPFVKPGPTFEYHPRLEPSGMQFIVKGTPLALNLKAVSWNPAGGEPRYSIEGEPPPGLKLDAASGSLKWDPGPEVAAGEYKVHVVAQGADDSSQSVAADLVFKLRNANQAPKFKKPAVPDAYLGRPLTLTVQADDPDAGDRVRYSLTGTPPAGATVDARTGTFAWTPAEDLAVGSYRAEITATDNGDPPLSDTTTLMISAKDDAARFTKLSGIIGLNGEMQAWFYDPSINKKTVVHVDEDFRFADVSGTMRQIDRGYVIFETNGQRMKLRLGEAVRDMTPAPAAAAPEGSVPPTKDPVGTATEPPAPPQTQHPANSDSESPALEPAAT